MTSTRPPGRLYLIAFESTFEQDLLEALAIRVYVPVVREPVGVAGEDDVAIAGERADERQRLPDRVGERDRLGRDGHPAGLDSRELEHLVDQFEQMSRSVEHEADMLALTGRRARRPPAVD